MNKSYKTVWNETTGTYVAASEVTKSSGKKSRNRKALVAALMAAGVGFGTAVKAEAAATPNSFAVGVLGTDAGNSNCISSVDGAVISTGADCSSGTGAQQAGIVSYDGSGNPGAYFTVTDPNTVHVGAGGVDQLKITNSGLFVLNALDMGGNKITNLASGAVSSSSMDAVNGMQLYATNQNVASVTSTVNGMTGGGGIKYLHVNSTGADSSTGGINAIAIGSSARSSGGSSIAIGDSSTDSAAGGVAIGRNASAVASGSYGSAITIGDGASSAGRSVAMGISAAAVDLSVAIGASAKVTQANTVAVGNSASATAANSVALGSASVANVANTVSVGTSAMQRQIVNVAAGKQATDAVNYSQLQAAGLKTDTNGNATNSFVAYGDATKGKVTLGGASGTTITNVAAGALSSSSMDAVNGTQLYTTIQNVEQNAAALAQNTSDISTNTRNIGQNTSDISTNASNIAQNATDIGTLNTQVSTINGEMADVVKYDSSAHDTLTLAGTSGTKISNVAAGEVSDSSSDAVNGSQLYATNQRVAQNSAAISQNTGDINAINSQIASLGSGVTGALAYDTAARDKVTLAGASGTTLTNVAAGAVSDSSKDAINGSQLYSTDQNVATNAAAISKNTSDIATNAGNIAQNTSDIAQHASDIAQNTNDIAKNTGDISNLDTRVTTVEGSVNDLANQINTGTAGLVQQNQASGDLTVAGNTGGTRVNLMGTAGPRELLGVAAGTTPNSAVNLGQLNPLVASLGGGAQVNADGSIVSPTYHMQGGTQNTVGDALDTLDTNLSSLETQINNGSIGMVTQNSTSRDLRIGATTDGTRLSVAGTAGNRVVTGVAAGAVNEASVDAVNGSQLHANAASTAAALGGGSTVNADGTISAPSYSVGGTTVNNVGAAIASVDGRVTQNTSDIASLQTTVGSISGSVANAVSYDTSAHNQVTLGGSAAAPKVKLTNLQDGDLSATSTDAVTGAQLWNTNQQLSDLSQSVQNQQQTGNTAMSLNAGGAPAAAATGNNAVALGGGSQASGDNSVAIGSGSVADQANTVSVGSQGNERRIANVADGHAATDAVNMRQFQSGINDVARSAYSGVAAATALTMIPDVDPGKTLAVGVAGATYKGYQAAAVGASARITANLKVKIGAGISGSDTTVGAGASYQW